jgi:hypothetical protein
LGGIGLQLRGAAVVDARRLAILRSHGSALLVGEPDTRMQAEDLTIRDTAPQQKDQTFGRGLEIQSGGTVTVSRARIERNRDVGVLVRRASAALDGVQIVDTSRPDCASQPSSCRHSATGALVFEGTLRITHSVVARSLGCGLSVGGDSSTLDLAHVMIADNGVGVCVHVDDFDTRRISDNDVEFIGNGSRIERTSLPPPDLLPASRDPEPSANQDRSR